MDYFEKLSGKIKSKWRNFATRLKAYFKRLFFPFHLFPLKLMVYSVYYFVKFAIKLLRAIIGLIVDCIVYPFKSLKNFLKSIFIIVVALYLFASLFVIADYLRTQYGYYGKFLCSFGAKENLQNSVVRIVGGYSEGSGFFISENQVITNFHVIADEPSPKIIFPNGKFITPVKIVGDKNTDLAVLSTQEDYSDLVLPLPDQILIYDEEPLIAAGYPMGTDLSGKATVIKGNFIDFRASKKDAIGFTQANISLVEGMSGGPLTDQCGEVIGINTISLGGQSLFINGDQAKNMIPNFTDQEIQKINVDPSISPEEAVKAFYTYLKARNMKEGFALLSQEYLKKTNYEEWTNRFSDILDVEIIKTEGFEDTDDTAFVKFMTKNWINGEVDIHAYEGTWQTVEEDGIYKMLKAKITEVENPDDSWFYE